MVKRLLIKINKRDLTCLRFEYSQLTLWINAFDENIARIHLSSFKYIIKRTKILFNKISIPNVFYLCQKICKLTWRQSWQNLSFRCLSLILAIFCCRGSKILSLNPEDRSQILLLVKAWNLCVFPYYGFINLI